MNDVNKAYQVIVSDRAADMLVNHVRFVAEFSLVAADTLREDLITALASLQSFPERNPWLSDGILPENKYRKMVVSRRYLLIYQVKNGKVYVEYIVDCRQDYQWLIR